MRIEKVSFQHCPPVQAASCLACLSLLLPPRLAVFRRTAFPVARCRDSAMYWSVSSVVVKRLIGLFAHDLNPLQSLRRQLLLGDVLGDGKIARK